MAAWRMAFRCGVSWRGGPDADEECSECPHEWWPRCRDLGVAAITYDPVANIDFTRYPTMADFPDEVRKAWKQLRGSQGASLRHFLFEMKKNDVIYVKQGPLIVGKGIVTGPYTFDKEDRIPYAHGGGYWRHQRPVKWDLTFPTVEIQIGYSPIPTVVPLDDNDVRRVEETARDESASWQRILEDPTPRPALSKEVDKVLEQIEQGKTKPLDPAKL